MKQGLKSEVGKPVFFIILAIAAIAFCWFGWNAMKSPYEKWDGKAQVDEAQRYQAAHGIDIRTVPTWSEMWYKYHPEDKRPRPPVQMPSLPGMGAVPGSTPSAPPVPGTSPVPGASPAAPQ
jgi:hypothetical protein